MQRVIDLRLNVTKLYSVKPFLAYSIYVAGGNATLITPGRGVILYLYLVR